METTVVKKVRRNSAIPPYYILSSDKSKYFIDEDLIPFHSKDEAKSKVKEIKGDDEDVFGLKFKILKHQGRYFVYRKTKK